MERIKFGKKTTVFCDKDFVSYNKMFILPSFICCLSLEENTQKN